MIVSILQFVQREKWLSRYVICVCVITYFWTKELISMKFGMEYHWKPQPQCFNFLHLTTCWVDLKQDGSHTNIAVSFSIRQ